LSHGARPARPLTLLPVLEQHWEDSALLFEARARRVQSPRMSLGALARLDELTDAHLDGLAVAAPEASRVLTRDPEHLDAGRVAAITAYALRSDRLDLLDWLSGVGSEVSGFWEVVGDGLAWISDESLAAASLAVVRHPPPWAAILSLVACRLTGRIAHELFVSCLSDGALPVVQMTCLKVAGELGVTALRARCAELARSANPQVAKEAVLAQWMIGERDVLHGTILQIFSRPDSSGRGDSLGAWFIQGLSQSQSFTALERECATHSQHGARHAELTSYMGLVGEVRLVHLVIDRMDTANLARAAGEAFTWITGADLEALGLDRDPPEDFQSGPNDDPNDDNVAMDEDEDLPWPDPVKVADWWHKNKHNFQPGVRYFMGKPVTVEHCIHVLKTGKQRQRFIAARYLKLLQPERPLFNCAAPAWRQQALLAKM
jgi:uncharacterized protein (TIGR02270 family)